MRDAAGPVAMRATSAAASAPAESMLPTAVRALPPLPDAAGEHLVWVTGTFRARYGGQLLERHPSGGLDRYVVGATDLEITDARLQTFSVQYAVGRGIAHSAMDTRGAPGPNDGPGIARQGLAHDAPPDLDEQIADLLTGSDRRTLRADVLLDVRITVVDPPPPPAAPPFREGIRAVTVRDVEIEDTWRDGGRIRGALRGQLQAVLLRVPIPKPPAPAPAPVARAEHDTVVAAEGDDGPRASWSSADPDDARDATRALVGPLGLGHWRPGAGGRLLGGLATSEAAGDVGAEGSASAPSASGGGDAGSGAEWNAAATADEWVAPWAWSAWRFRFARAWRARGGWPWAYATLRSPGCVFGVLRTAALLVVAAMAVRAIQLLLVPFVAAMIGNSLATMLVSLAVVATVAVLGVIALDEWFGGAGWRGFTEGGTRSFARLCVLWIVLAFVFWSQYEVAGLSLLLLAAGGLLIERRTTRAGRGATRAAGHRRS